MAMAAGASAALSYIPVNDLAAGLADGQSWDMVASDGKKGRLRFDRDGTGKIESPVNLKIKWVIKGNSFCMKMGFMLGTKCFQGVKSGNGYQGYTDGKASITFSR